MIADGPLALGDPIPERSNILFRAYRFEPDFPAFEEKELVPAGPLENEKGSSTATPTEGPEEPVTETPTSIPVTPTATPTATATSTATEEPALPGDVNGVGTITSVDALLVLQYGADLLEALANLEGADVNGDGVVDSVDAALILQHVAGLLPSLPPIGTQRLATPGTRTNDADLALGR